MPFGGAADGWLDITFCLTGAFHQARGTGPLERSVHRALSASTFSGASMGAGTPASPLLHHLSSLFFSLEFGSLLQGFQHSSLIIRHALRATPELLALKSEGGVAALPRFLPGAADGWLQVTFGLRCACALHHRARSTGPLEHDHYGARSVQKSAWVRADLNWC